MRQLVFIVLLLNIIVPILKTSGKSSHFLVTDWYKWSVLISTIGGLAVAGYLTFIEATGAQIACGPSSECDTVQNSRYAILFGFLPVGILGLAGYVGILVAWLASQFGSSSIKRIAALAIWATCVFCVLFEIYLILELFVIGATCMWCISSAVLLMIILLLVSTPAAQQAFVIKMIRVLAQKD
ncbi:MAG: vitamin K epoxide reductase family protein [Anaerolineales bacterium]|uniref:vitamin K epoxide reductase family protein n=1 Tax=Candidatus Villigracilis proximus TaxID=3140683 RepID=UPI0031370D09|nr:vitamin K epoxide reductase family protein [Anaerolineales bacterium]